MKPPIVAPIPVEMMPDKGSSVMSDAYAPNAAPPIIEAVLALKAIIYSF